VEVQSKTSLKAQSRGGTV